MPARVAGVPALFLIGLCLGLLAAGCGDRTPRPAEYGASDEDVTGIHIARWHGDRQAAISYTFDDGLPDHGGLAAPLLEQYGFRGTFFICPGLTVETDSAAAAGAVDARGGTSWECVIDLASRGHEIGNHSWSHPDLKQCTETELAFQVTASSAEIDRRLGTPPFTFCYPFNKKNHRVRRLVYRHHHAAREYQHDWGGEQFSTQTVRQQLEQAVNTGSWLVPMLHGIEHGYHAFTNRQVLADHLAEVRRDSTRFWVDTYGTVARYEIERDEVELHVEQRPTTALLTLVTSLDTTVYNQPLTVVVPVARGCDVQARRQTSGNPVPVKVRADRILVDITPGSEPVLVQWQEE
ncbi:MAG: polysaccharide deacetylase family protein [bacterium]